MALPKIYSAHETVDVCGSLIDLRVITRAEAARLNKMLEAGCPKDELEIEVISIATDTPADEVRDWYANTPGYAVEELIGHINRVSRFEEGAQKSG